ncbi:N-6 DNA methylase [Vibrio alginolyticus]
MTSLNERVYRLMNPHSLPKKRELGAYYTPPELSQVLADWAIQKPNEDILEPSFGGCGFFVSCINQLEKLGCSKPEKQLYGADIDEHAFDILHQKFGGFVETKKRFILNDFIKIQPSDFLVDKFDVVIGNPPYVSMHNMTVEQRESCERVIKSSNFSAHTMGRNSSLWAFFLLHSLSFLKDSGRVAWVLPSSLLHADYAEKLLNIHQKHFSDIKILKLAERFFKDEGAQETSVVLMADGFCAEGTSKCHLIVQSVENIDGLKASINNTRRLTGTNFKDYKLDLLTEEARIAYKSVLASDFALPLSHYADLKIGMVTGANKYFIVNQSTIDEFDLPKGVLKPVIGRFHSLSGLTHGKSQQRRIEELGHRCFLVCPPSQDMKDKDSAVYRYLSQIDAEERAKNRTFKKRPEWFAPGWGIDGIIPDAFLSYMIHRSPRMVVNKGKYNCTNSIHKVIFHDRRMTAAKKLAISISLLSTFSQFSAEIEGRAYSSGVLKIEPTAGKRIKVLLSDEVIEPLNRIQKAVEVELKQENHRGVANLVDSILINHGLITETQCWQLERAVHDLRRERYKGVKVYSE